MAKTLTKVAAIVLGLALPVAVAIPASAAITTGPSDDRINRVEKLLELDKGELADKLAKVDMSRLDTGKLDKLQKLTDKAIDASDDLDKARTAQKMGFGAASEGALPGLPDTSILTDLLNQILDLVKGLLASLGLSLPDLPVPLPQSDEEALPVPGLPDTSFLTDLLSQILDLVKGLLASLGLSLPDLPLPLPAGDDGTAVPGLPDTSFLTDLIDQVLSVVMDLLASLGLGGAVPDLPVPVPDSE